MMRKRKEKIPTTFRVVTDILLFNAYSSTTLAVDNKGSIPAHTGDEDETRPGRYKPGCDVWDEAGVEQVGCEGSGPPPGASR